MLFELNQNIATIFSEPPAAEPSIKGWNRLEGRPRNVDFERALRAEVRDALWFLARQWQFGEFKGEDAGSPVDARLVTSQRSLHRYRAAKAEAVAYDPTVPLEMRVERERPPFDLVTHRQVTRVLFQLIGSAPDASALGDGLIGAYPLKEGDIEGYLDKDSIRLFRMGKDRLLNARSLLKAIEETHSYDGTVDSFTGVGAASRAICKSAGAEISTWFRDLYGLPAQATAWVPERLEYQFACSVAATDSSETVLAAESYDDGELDWWAFDVSKDAFPDADTSSAKAEKREVLSFIPAPVTFAGMPSPRFWEMEDRKVEFADIDAGTNDLAKIMLTEFALAFSNDWCLVPCVLDVGSLTRVEGLVVTDTFGERLSVRPAGRGLDENWQTWRMFVLETQESRDVVEPALFLTPVTAKQLAGEVTEKVVFLRDEMANMAWAVEALVPSAAGGGIDGYRVASEVQPPPIIPPPMPEGVDVRYELGSDTPWNWRPFVPVHLDGGSRAIKLRRARMPGPDRPIRGRVLAVPGTYDLFEEECTRAGVQVRVGFQRARWTGGTIHLWLGRRAQTGRGEGSSGLGFDRLREQGDEKHVR